MRWKNTFKDKTGGPDHLIVKADRKLHKVLVDSILYIEALKDYIRIHTTEDRIVFYGNMKDII